MWGDRHFSWVYDIKKILNRVEEQGKPEQTKHSHLLHNVKITQNVHTECSWNQIVTTKISRLGSWYPNFKRVSFPRPVNQLYSSLGDRPINPPPPPPRQICTSCLWTMIDRTGPSESGWVMVLRNTTAVVIIMLGFMTYRVWHEQDSGKVGGGGGKKLRLSQTKSSK